MLSPPPFLDDRRVLLNIGWQPPPVDYLKINMDGAFNQYSKMAACGGINRDANGAFDKGFICNMGFCSNLRAELLTLLNGLKVARSLSIGKAIFETDSKAIINYVFFYRQKVY